MAGKIPGDLGPDTGKVVGGLEKSPTEDVPDAGAYDPASYSSYDGSSGGSSGSPDYGGGGSSSYSADDDTSGGTSGDTGSDTDDASADEDSDVPKEADSDESDDDGLEGGDEPGDGATGEDTGEGDGQPEMWTQPDKQETGNEENGHGGGWVGIDLQAMTTLIAAMERARDQLPEYEAEFQRIFRDVNIIQAYETLVPTTSQLSAVTAWIEDELPGLRRRLALAQALEGDSPYHAQPDSQPRQPVAYDENQISEHAPHVAAEHGRESALLFATPPDSTMVNKLVAQLRANLHDPYFAHELTGSADPEAVAATLEAARDQPGVEPDRVDELQRLLESTVRTAGRGTGELAPSDDFQDQWGQLAGTAQPADA